MSKRGRSRITLTYSDLEYAYQSCKSLKQAAKFLNVSYETFKREAKLYRRKGTDKTFYELLYNQKGIGVSKPGGGNPSLIKRELKDILEGKYPEFGPYKVQERLLKTDMYLPRRCAVCGFFEVREDGKIPLRLDFIDGDTTNHRLENLRWLCYNHYFMFVGWHGKSLHASPSLHKFDPKNIKAKKDKRLKENKENK